MRVGGRLAKKDMPSINDSSYDRNRRVGSGGASSAGGDVGGGTGDSFRPRLGATLQLFGSPVTLGPEHALALLLTYVVAKLEGVIALVVLFLAWFYMKSQPDDEPAAASRPRSAPRQQRRPGLWGALMHFVGPVPEGAPVTLAGADEVQDAPQQPVVSPSKPGAEPAAIPKPTPAPWTAADEAKASATRAAAARAAAARADAAAARAME